MNRSVRPVICSKTNANATDIADSRGQGDELRVLLRGLLIDQVAISVHAVSGSSNDGLMMCIRRRTKVWHRFHYNIIMGYLTKVHTYLCIYEIVLVRISVNF